MNYGDLVTVSCALSGGDVPVEMFWYFNGKPINDYAKFNDIILRKEGKKLFLLMIETVSAKHIGNYTCSAKNRAGIVEYTADLKVNG